MTIDGILGIIFLFFIIAILILRICFVVIIVEGQSMFPTLHEQDRVLAFRYWPKRWLKKGQIVIIESKGQAGEWPLTPDDVQNPTAPKSTRYIKRLVALAGESYLTTNTRSLQGNKKITHEWKIPAGHYFACGDNLDNSFDSRQFGPVPSEKIWGVMLIHWRSHKEAVTPTLALDLKNLPGILPGQPAPPFLANTLQGQSVSLATFTDQTIALVFIEKSDKCIEALVSYTNDSQLLKNAGVELIIVSLLTENETINLMENYPNITTPVLIAPEQTNTIKKDYRIDHTPFFSVINAQGKIQASGYGANNYQDLLLHDIEEKQDA